MAPYTRNQCVPVVAMVFGYILFRRLIKPHLAEACVKSKYSGLLFALLNAFRNCHTLANKWQDSLELFVSQSCGAPSFNLTGRHTSKLNLNPTIYPFRQLWKVFFICP